MNRSLTTILVAVVILACCLLLAACGLIGSVQSTQISLLEVQQKVQRGQAQYSGALDIVSQKITGAFDLADRQISHEDRAYKQIADAYAAFGSAKQTGTPVDQVAAARAFQLQFTALASNFPQFASADVVKTAMNAMEEAVNEIFTAFQDWQNAVLAYNSYRGQFFMPIIVGNALGYPQSYAYYEGAAKRLDIKELIPPTPKAP